MHREGRIILYRWCSWWALLTALIQDPSLLNERNPFSNITLEKDGASQGDWGAERRGVKSRGKQKRDKKWGKQREKRLEARDREGNKEEDNKKTSTGDCSNIKSERISLLLQYATTTLCSTVEGLITDQSITVYEKHSKEKNSAGFPVCMYETKSCSRKLPPAVNWSSARILKSNIPAKAWSSIKVWLLYRSTSCLMPLKCNISPDASHRMSMIGVSSEGKEWNQTRGQLPTNVFFARLHFSIHNSNICFHSHITFMVYQL